MGTGKQRWKITLIRKQPPQTPQEFLCPLSGSTMADPVIVSSGHTFERNLVQACLSLGYAPTLFNTRVDFTTIIPNLALKTTISNWCHNHHMTPPVSVSFSSAREIIRRLVPRGDDVSVVSTSSDENGKNKDEIDRQKNSAAIISTPLQLTTRPMCYSSHSSSSSIDIEISNSEEEELLQKLKNCDLCDQEEALKSLRKLTRTREETRVTLCTPRLLSALKSLIGSRYTTLQVNAVAALVNLSLEKQNKVKMVRSGIVPPVIDVLRCGTPDSRDHAAGVLFSLSLEDQNKTAIGVLGALPPLLHALRSESERTRQDSALALYHLSLVHSNRVKMIKLGAVQSLLGMAKTGHMLNRVMLILCNFAASVEGRTSMLDNGAVECFVGLMSQDKFDSSSTRESFLAAFYGLSYGGLRFKGLAKEAGAEEVLRKVENVGSDQAKAKVKKVLEVLMERHEEDEDVVDWEELLSLNGDLSTRTVANRLNGSSSGG